MIIIYVEETFARGLVLRRVPDLRRPMSIPAEIDDVELRQRLESKQVAAQGWECPTIAERRVAPVALC